MKTICAFCDQPIEQPAKAYRGITGWVKPRKSGGANAVALKEETGALAHPLCVEGGKLGWMTADVIPGQLVIS